MTTRQNLTIRQGETWSWTYTVRDASGALVNLTGYTARMSVKRSYDADADVFLSTGADANGGTIVLGGAAGTVALSMTDEQTDAMEETSWWFAPDDLARCIDFIYDLELVSALGAVTRLLEGIVTFHRSVTGPF